LETNGSQSDSNRKSKIFQPIHGRQSSMDVLDCQCDACMGIVRPTTPSNEEIEQIINELQILEKNAKLSPQSGMEKQIFKCTTASNTPNVQFQDSVEPYCIDMGGHDDGTRTLHDNDEASFAEFFKRPVKIFQESWGTGNLLSAEVSPFFAYFTNPRVANRISNFNLLKADLHIKVMVNGNGFFYGKAMAAYHPLFNYDFLSSHAALVPQDLTQTSQLPKVFIDPNTSAGGEMILPFFWHQDYIDITSSLDTTADIGTLFIRSINSLKHANTNSDSVTVTILAWCESISLAVPTAENAWQMTPQSGKEDEIDEANKEGIVSGPASNLAKIGKGLASVPVIGPYAQAASYVANGVAQGAKLLGYSRPPTSSLENVRPFATTNMALGNVPDSVNKLSLDEKQALTLDPRTASIAPEDPLAVRNIACRESYLTKFNWFRQDNSGECLFQSYVSPVLWTKSGTNTVHFPACAAATMPFLYWTGTIKFRFQIVSSSYHRGRLRFVYDPNLLPWNYEEYNVNYQQVIDIGETKDVTIEIGMGKPLAYLLHEDPADNPIPFVTNPIVGTTLPRSNLEKNGVLGVYVVNELAAANTTAGNNNVEVNVFISAGDDFMVAGPDDKYQRYVFKPQSGMEAQDGDNTDEPNAPEQKMSLMVNPTVAMDKLNEVYMGETIPSFRTLLKRYSIHRRLPLRDGVIQTGPTNSRFFERSCAFPYLRGNVPGAIDTTGLGDPYNYCNTVLIHWIRNMFAGWRGGIRYKVAADECYGTSLTSTSIKMVAERASPVGAESPLYTTDYTEFLPSDLTNAKAKENVIKGNPFRYDITRGGTMATSTVNPILEFEIPYYAPVRFCPSKRSDYTGVTAYLEIPQMYVNAQGSFSRYGTMDYYVAAGEDFQVFFFTGMPRVYFEATPPDA